MKAELRELTTDLKAAVRIGHPDSVLAALDGLRAYPGVAGNQALDEPFLEQVILPLGRILAAPSLDEAVLRQLSQEALTAHRALAAVALGQRWLSGGEIWRKIMRQLAQDRRAKVGRSLALSLGELNPANLDIWRSLVEPWLVATSPRLRRTGLWALECAIRQASVKEKLGPLAIQWLEPYGNERDEEVARALVTTFVALAESGLAKEVCAVLGSWLADDTKPNEWVIIQTLSGGWAKTARTPALAVLDQLEARVGATRAVRNTRRNLVSG